MSLELCDNGLVWGLAVWILCNFHYIRRSYLLYLGLSGVQRRWYFQNKSPKFFLQNVVFKQQVGYFLNFLHRTFFFLRDVKQTDWIFEHFKSLFESIIGDFFLFLSLEKLRQLLRQLVDHGLVFKNFRSVFRQAVNR